METEAIKFMQQFFQERTAALKRQLAIHQFYWRQFYDSECLWDSRRNVVENSAAERVLSVSTSGVELRVVTTGTNVYRSRYHLNVSPKVWTIQEVDTEYPGVGWRSWKDSCYVPSPERTREQSCHRESSSSAEPGCDPIRARSIERFMAEHFRERTATLKREREIYGEFARRFFSSQCDWTRWVQSVEQSEAESIVNVASFDTGAYVVTRNLDIFEHRYRLRSVGKSWLIWTVDTECPVCWCQGRNPNCFWCDGTIWEHNEGQNTGSPGYNHDDLDDGDPLQKPRWLWRPGDGPVS
jgi:hypothetical protein